MYITFCVNLSFIQRGHLYIKLHFSIYVYLKNLFWEKNILHWQYNYTINHTNYNL